MTRSADLPIRVATRSPGPMPRSASAAAKRSDAPQLAVGHLVRIQVCLDDRERDISGRVVVAQGPGKADVRAP